ncbi:MAG: hypothetical protein QM662_02555 [Gordonia sp. (in: high G+C Gram-positive bacteria)]
MTAPLTAAEAALIQESILLDRLILDATGDDDAELRRRHLDVLVRLRDSRRQTWDEWLTNQETA